MADGVGAMTAAMLRAGHEWPQEELALRRGAEDERPLPPEVEVALEAGLRVIAKRLRALLEGE